VNLSGAGTAVDAENAVALAAAVLNIYKMTPAERNKMGKNGRRYYEEHFDREKLLDNLESWLIELKVKKENE
jgi:colanic acid biosynthesis glycosyl transferase WcaI